MILSKVWDRLSNIFFPFTGLASVDSQTRSQPIDADLRAGAEPHTTQSPRTSQLLPQPIQLGNTDSCPDNAQHSPLTHDPYLDLPVLGIGMTGIDYKLGEDRVVKKAKRSQLRDAGDAEYMSKINQETLENEIQVFKRLGNYKGVIPCFRTSQYGIELACAQDDLEAYLEKHPEPENSLKVEWIQSLINTFSYIHACRVFVDDIAPRNILILDKQLQVADFGQSILLPPDADIASVTENDLNLRIEILHIGWILYSIASWQVQKYYFFNDNPDLCWRTSFPNVDNAPCAKIIKECWEGQYPTMDHVKLEARQAEIGIFKNEIAK